MTSSRTNSCLNSKPSRGVAGVEVAGQNEQRVNISFRPNDVNDKNVVTTSVPDELTAAGTVVPAGQSATR